MKTYLHKNLPKLLSNKGVSMKMLSQKFNVPVKTLYGWTAGPMIPKNIILLKEICNYLETSLDEILFSDKPIYGQKFYVKGNRIEILFTC